MGTIKTTNIEPIADNGTVTLGSSGDTFTLGSGVTQTIAVNTPAFYAYASTTTSMPNATGTKITLNSEVFDTNSAFASSTFTVPSNQAGKYFFAAGLRQGGATSNRFIIQIRLNTSTVIAEMELSGGVSGAMTAVVSTVSDLSVSDAIEVYGYQDQGTTQPNAAGLSNTWLTGFKLIGV